MASLDSESDVQVMLIYLINIYLFVFCAETLGVRVVVTTVNLSKAVEFYEEEPYCRVFTDRKDIQAILTTADNASTVRDDQISIFENSCRSGWSPRFKLIMPNTNYCGDGDRAKYFDDLGIARSVDMCCREHDNCEFFLEAEDCLCNRTFCNPTRYTRSHCDCDAIFRACLKNTNDWYAYVIETIFFCITKTKCFKEKLPSPEEQRNLTDKTIKEECSYEFIPSHTL